MLNLAVLVGAIGLIGGSLGYFILPYGITMGIKSIMNLAENGMIFPKYMHPDGVGALQTYYLFAITNPNVVLAGGKASFQLKGPYEFEERTERGKIAFRARGQRVAFETKRSSVLKEHHSADMDEKMWLINPIMISMSHMARSIVLDRVPFRRLAEPLMFGGLNMAIEGFNEHLMLKTTPRKMLVGRHIQAFESLTSFGIRYGFEAYLPDGVFSLVASRNETVEVWTGVGKTKDRFADVAKYEGKKQMEVWREGGCNNIAGTNGELYKPFPRPGRPLKIFAGGLCRTILMDPVGKELVKTELGVMALEYAISSRLYQGIQSNPANECYCENSRTYDCQYDGLVAMGPCFSGAPVYLSRVNFKEVDPRIRDLVDWQSALHLNGTGRDSSNQLTDRQSLKIDPVTGLVLECELNMMVLFKMVRHPRLKDAAKIQPLTYMPLFAISIVFKLPPEAAWPLYILQKIYNYQGMAMIGTAMSGLAVLVLGTVV